MTRLLQNDLEAEAITLVAEAVRLEKGIRAAEITEDAADEAIRLYVKPRHDAAAKLRAAKSALYHLVAVNMGKVTA